jgi:hypothetical protein
MIGLREEEREAVSRKMMRKITARAHYFAAAELTPGKFEHELTANQQGAIDAEFVDISSTPDYHGQARQQQLIVTPQPIAQPRSGGHVKLRPATPSAAAERLTGSSRERDRQLLAELLATPPSERPAF